MQRDFDAWLDDHSTAAAPSRAAQASGRRDEVDSDTGSAGHPDDVRQAGAHAPHTGTTGVPHDDTDDDIAAFFRARDALKQP